MNDWRVFIGLWSDQDVSTHVDKWMSWFDAHAFMVDRFQRWADDDCPDCMEHAAEQLPSLLALDPETAWEGEVEGDDYMITQDASLDPEDD